MESVGRPGRSTTLACSCHHLGSLEGRGKVHREMSCQYCGDGWECWEDQQRVVKE